MNRSDLAWAAGFFDAEGCFANTSTPVATVAQTQLEPLDIFLNVVSVGKIGGPYEKSTAKIKRKPQWVYYAYGKRARAVFDALRPWLGKYRIGQAATAFGRDFRIVDVSLEDLPRAEQLAWAGGFFDGEGCFSVCGDGLNARINNTDVDLLEQFQSVVAIGKIYGPYQPHRTSFGKSPHYVYTVSGFERVQALLGLLWDHIASAKRQRAIEILHDHLNYWKCGHQRGTKWKMHCPQCFNPGPKPGFKTARVRDAGTAQLFPEL